MDDLIKLTQEDKKKINNTHEYKLYKELTIARKTYMNFEVGTAIFIKHKGSGELITRYAYAAKKHPPTKFLIVENDEGFIFAKRILSTGKTGKDIICITSQYEPSRYELIPDDAMVDAMLLDQQYDPANEAKELKKKKNKATRINSKYRISFEDPQEAYKYLKNLKPGDKIWQADTTFGDGIVEFEVLGIMKKPVKKVQKKSYYYGDDMLHRYHEQEGFDYFLEVELKYIRGQSNLCRYSTFNNETLYFMYLCTKDQYKYFGNMMFSHKPVTVEDL